MKESEMFRANKILEANKRKMEAKEMRKKRAERKKPIKPSGSITPLRSYFKFKSKNIGTFPKPEIERNDNPE